MKKCPNCQKTFEDQFRFCQNDGTPLVDDMPAAPPADPFKTVVSGHAPVAGDELLDLPDFDPMKTVVASSRTESSIPPPPSIVPSMTPELPAEPPAPEASIPEPMTPPSFSEPSVPPPSFGNLSGSDAVDVPLPPPPMAVEDPKFTSAPLPSEAEAPTIIQNEPMFQPQSFEPPPSPFSPPSPFDEPQANQPAFQAAEWNPPPAPMAAWQDQGLGANTPFQPPMGAAGQNQTLAIVSLVCGILGLCCGLPGIAALITGYIAKNKADTDPQNYGGRGMAIAGMVLGAISVIFTILYILLNLLGIFANMAF